jgi:hypothetical protein
MAAECMNYSCGGNLPKYFLDTALQGILTELFGSGKLRGLQGYPPPPNSERRDWQAVCQNGL